MKILLSTLYSYPQKGGLGTYIKELAKELTRQGHQVDIFACHPSYTGYYMVQGRLVRTEQVRQGLYQTHPELNPQDTSLDPWIWGRELEFHTFARAVSGFDLTQYDVVHTQDVFSTRALVELLGPHKPIVQTLHGSIAYDMRMIQGDQVVGTDRWKYAAAAELSAVEASRVTITPSKWLKGLLVETSHVPEDHVKVIPNGIDVPAFLRIMTMPSPGRDSPRTQVITCIGHLSDLKGQQYLIESLAMLKNHRSDWVCWLVGDGPKRTELKQLSQGLGLTEHVLFLGTRDDIPSLLSRSDIFVLPSLTENCPYSVLEAQVAGTPVIASDVGGIPEIVEHGVTGFLVPPANPDALYRMLQRVLADDSLSRTVKQNCEQLCREKWSMQTLVQEVGVFYCSTAKGAQ